MFCLSNDMMSEEEVRKAIQNIAAQYKHTDDNLKKSVYETIILTLRFVLEEGEMYPG